VAAQRVLGYLWAYLVSNQGPLPCEGSALPLSYTPGKPITLHGTRRSPGPYSRAPVGRPDAKSTPLTG
jgi:hypothetical protein